MQSMVRAGALAVAWSMLLVKPAVCEDVVHAAVGDNARARTRLTGEVLDYTGTTLTLRLPGGAERVFPAERVFLIETERTAEHLRGDKLKQELQFAAALDQYRAALAREPRRWVRREILSKISVCHRELGELLPAAQNFLLLVESDTSTPHFPAIPLAWQPSAPPPPLAAAAAQWMAQTDNSIAALLGASHLLSSDRRDEALARLKQLSYDRDPRVAWLARAQSWRASLQSAGELRIETWASEIEKAPEQLRGGAYFVLGQALALAQEHERAALALLRVPILYLDDRALSSQAILTAAGQLEAIGQKSEAATLYDELRQQYAETPAARQAEARAKKLPSSQPRAPQR
jgi:tetratricopeptide (TPR) repeat protein